MRLKRVKLSLSSYYISEKLTIKERSLTFELNGKARTTIVQDKSVKGEAKAREKADPSNLKHVPPIPAMVSSISTSVGKTVAKGEKIAALEAMKCNYTLPLQTKLLMNWLVGVGDSVESKDLNCSSSLSIHKNSRL